MEPILEEPNAEQLDSVDVLFIGAGPATLSFFSHLIKQKQIGDFSRKNKFAIVEKSNQFGAGCLGKYLINTNTSAQGFLRLIQEVSIDKPKDAKMALSPPKNHSKSTNKPSIQVKRIKSSNSAIEESEPVKNIKPLDMFVPVLNASCGQALKAIGSKVAPLVVVGHFLSCVGNLIAAYFHEVLCLKPLLFGCEAIEIKRENSKYKVLILKQTTRGRKLFWITTNKLIFATGGKQKYSSTWLNKINSSIPQGNLFNSDYFLQEIGYRRFLSLAESYKQPIVTIVGGSHSAFSCAWLILNGSPVKFNHQGFRFVPVVDDNCRNCADEKCCYGDAQYYFAQLKELTDVQINIVYRDIIKVFYSSEKEAEEDGYIAYKGKKSKNKKGAVWPFVGLRGDAKELYRQVIKRKEKRINLIKSSDIDQIEELCKNSNVVIWAVGYSTNSVDIKDEQGKRLKLKTGQDGSLEVDKDLRIIDNKGKGINNLYGIGQGYATFSVEVINGVKMRADSISLYNTVIAKKLFSSLNTVFNDVPVVETKEKREKSKKTMKTATNKKKEDNVYLKRKESKEAGSDRRKTDKGEKKLKIEKKDERNRFNVSAMRLSREEKGLQNSLDNRRTFKGPAIKLPQIGMFEGQQGEKKNSYRQKVIKQKTELVFPDVNRKNILVVVSDDEKLQISKQILKK